MSHSQNQAPAVYEHNFIVELAHVIGLEPLTQSHIELERECHQIVDEGLTDRTRDKRTLLEKAKAAAEAAAAAVRGAGRRPAPDAVESAAPAGLPLVEFGPGDETALDSVAFKVCVCVCVSHYTGRGFLFSWHTCSHLHYVPASCMTK